MNLMRLIRLLVLLSIGWTAVALGAGVLGVGARPTAAPTYFIPRPSFHDAFTSAQPLLPGSDEFHLVDRTTGRIDPFPVPEDDRWGLFSVSPWRDREGNLEAVGRWVIRTDVAGEQAFCGLGLFRLPDGMVKSRISLEVLPTGRPCWVPGRPREFLFPAGDGRLHRCQIALDAPLEDSAPLGGPVGRDGERAAQPRAVTWQCEPPGRRDTFLADPVWPSEPRLRRFVFVALSRQVPHGKKMVYEPSKLWWLEMSEHADAILAAGPLTRPGPEGSQVDGIMERSPNVAVDPEGKISLVYLTRRPAARLCQLRSAALEIDRESGRPRINSPRSTSHLLDEGLAPAPLMVSADGRSVYAAAGDGRIVKYPIPR